MYDSEPNSNFEKTSNPLTESESLLVSDSATEQQKELKKIKKQWRQKQHKNFQKIQRNQLDKKNSKSAITLLVSLAVIIFSAPFFLKVTQNTIANTFTDSQNNQSQSDSESPNILDKLKALEKRSQTQDFESDCVQTSAATVCKSDQGETVNNQNTQEPTITDQVDQSIGQIEEYNRRLKEVMDGS